MMYEKCQVTYHYGIHHRSLLYDPQPLSGKEKKDSGYEKFIGDYKDNDDDDEEINKNL